MFRPVRVIRADGPQPSPDEYRYEDQEKQARNLKQYSSAHAAKRTQKSTHSARGGAGRLARNLRRRLYGSAIRNGRFRLRPGRGGGLRGGGQALPGDAPATRRPMPRLRPMILGFIPSIMVAAVRPGPQGEVLSRSRLLAGDDGSKVVEIPRRHPRPCSRWPQPLEVPRDIPPARTHSTTRRSHS